MRVHARFASAPLIGEANKMSLRQVAGFASQSDDALQALDKEVRQIQE